MNIDNETLDRAKNGDEKALELIINTYKGFIYSKAKNFFINGAEKSDVIQEGTIGFFKAIKSYNKDKLSSFNSFAALCIQRNIITAIRIANSEKNLTNFIEIDEIYLKSNNYTEDEYISKNELESLTTFFKENLSKMELEVFGYLISGYEYREISSIMKKDLKIIDNTIQRIRKKSINWIKDRK